MRSRAILLTALLTHHEPCHKLSAAALLLLLLLLLLLYAHATVMVHKAARWEATRAAKQVSQQQSIRRCEACLLHTIYVWESACTSSCPPPLRDGREHTYPLTASLSIVNSPSHSMHAAQPLGPFGI